MNLKTTARKIWTITTKEWAEVFKNKYVLFTVAFLPLLMTAIPLGIIYSTRQDTDFSSATSEMPAQFSAMCPPGIGEGECFQIFLVSQFMLMFMIIPLAIPAAIASYSIVGEKVNRSLEPLLATPIRTIELLAGKTLAAIIPALIATWIGFTIFLAGTWILLGNSSVLAAFVDLRWIIAIFVAGPLMALSAVTFSVIVSSRVNDPRIAEQVSMIIILPLLGIFFGQMAGLFVLNRQVIVYLVIALFLLDSFLVYLSVQLFQRETILTRWK